MTTPPPSSSCASIARNLLGLLAVVCVALPLLPVVPGPIAVAAGQPSGDAQPTVETDPVAHSGDAADDPAIWYNAADPARSAVIGNDKQGALEVYDLAGHRIQRITGGFFGNVDVRRGFDTGTGRRDLVVTWHNGITVYAIDPSTRQLSNITDGSGAISGPSGGEGLCLYRSEYTGRTYAFVNARNGHVAQYELTDSDGDGKVEGTLRRDWDVGSETEGCVADDALGWFYISEEGVGIWKYRADPDASSARSSRTLVDAVVAKGGHIRPDAEGLTLVYGAGRSGFLVVSSQAASDSANSYVIYARDGDNAFVRNTKVVTGPLADGCGRTDGIDALAMNMGPAFPNGMFVCQDNANTAPAGGHQNFKFVPLDRLVTM